MGKGLRWFGAYRKIRQRLHPGKEERLKSGDQKHLGKMMRKDLKEVGFEEKMPRDRMGGIG